MIRSIFLFSLVLFSAITFSCCITQAEFVQIQTSASPAPVGRCYQITKLTSTNKFIVFGGSPNLIQFFDDLWKLDLESTPATWTKIVTTNHPNVTVILNEYGAIHNDILYVFISDPEGLGGVYAVDVSDNAQSPVTWQHIKIAQQVNSLLAFSVITYGDYASLFGGFKLAGESTRNLYRFSFKDHSWKALSPCKTASGFQNGYTDDNGNLYFANVRNSTTSNFEHWKYNIAADSWTELASQIKHTLYNTMQYYKGQAVSYGPIQDIADNLVEGYDLASNSWSTIPYLTRPNPPTRIFHSAVNYKGNMLVFGGIGMDKGQTQFLNDLWELKIADGK